MSADTHTKPRKFVQDRDAVAWKGRYEPYDLAKEFLVALIVVIILVAGLAVLFGSPDDKPVTVRSWSTADAGRLRPDGGHRARRHQRDGDLRPPLQPERHRPVDRAHLARASGSASTTRSTRPRTSSSARCRTLPEQPPGPGGAAASTGRRRPPSRRRGRRPTRRPWPTPPSRTASWWCPPGDYGPVATFDRRARRRWPAAAPSTVPCSPPGSSTGPTTPSPSCSSPTASTWPTWPTTSTSAATSGG